MSNLSYSVCQHQQRNRSNTCDTAIASFTPDKWLASDNQVGHLFDGLTYLLQAAQEWKLQEELTLEVSGYPATIYAMDSVFLRARSLFEFFIGTSPRTYCHAQCIFGLSSQLDSPRYTDISPGYSASWEDVLHIGSVHLKDRDSPVQLEGYNGMPKDLNQMPIDFAQEILRVWSDFEKELLAQGHTHLQKMAEDCQLKARENSREVIQHVADRAPAYAQKIKAITPLF